MKLLIHLIAGSFVLFACNPVKKINANNVAENIWEHGNVDTFYVNPKFLSDTTTVHIEYTFAKPSESLKEITDSLVFSYLDEKSTATVSRKVFEQHAIDFIADYADLAKQDSLAVFPWWLDIGIDFCFIDSTYVKAEFHSEVYMGGAHGNVIVVNHMIDSRTKKLVTLKELFSDVKLLEKRAEVIFRKSAGIASNANLTDEGFWFENGIFKLNDNFYFDNKNIVFVYNQYEIAPYSMGMFYVEIPLSELKDIKQF